MDLCAVMMDRAMLQCIARDLRDDVMEMGQTIKPKVLFGDKESACVDDYPLVAGRLNAMLEPEAPLWQLQYAFLVTLYLSDRAVDWLKKTAKPRQVDFFLGGTTFGVAPFCDRFEHHLIGKFKPKEKKGERKVVAIEACSPHVAVVNELLLAHTLVSWQ